MKSQLKVNQYINTAQAVSSVHKIKMNSTGKEGVKFDKDMCQLDKDHKIRQQYSTTIEGYSPERWYWHDFQFTDKSCSLHRMRLQLLITVQGKFSQDSWILFKEN